jgi:uncharacterized protein YprB with RNaseH-like and TPR domain/Zn ribbon nucleic-acid-binding protein
MAGKLRKLVTDEEIRSALDHCEGSITEAARYLSDLIGHVVSVSLMSRWASELNYRSRRTEPPKVLIFDIETTPILAYTWGLWQQNIPIGAIVDDWKVLCWSAKWLGHHKMYNANTLYDSEEEVVEKLWFMLDEAEVVVAHNGKQFDVKKMNAKFMEYRLPQPSYYQVVDTLQVARGNLALTSNKLDWIAKFLEEDRKSKVDFDLWLDCMNGCPKAYKKMQKYCDQDVRVLERVYLKLRPLDKRTPNMGAYTGKHCCPACGSQDVYYATDKYTAAGTYQVYQCVDCGHNMKLRNNTKPKNEERFTSV